MSNPTPPSMGIAKGFKVGQFHVFSYARYKAKSPIFLTSACAHIYLTNNPQAHEKVCDENEKKKEVLSKALMKAGENNFNNPGSTIPDTIFVK